MPALIPGAIPGAAPAGPVAVTVWQPYAGLLAWGVKPVEMRTRGPGLSIGSRLLIHAGLNYNVRAWEHAMGVLASIENHRTRKPPPWPLVPTEPNPDADPEGVTPYGAIIGEVTLEEVRRAARPGDPWWMESEGAVGWYVRRPVAILPVPCRGNQGIWRVPADAAAEALARVAAEVDRQRRELDEAAARNGARCPRCRAPAAATEELALACSRDPSHTSTLR